MAHHHAAPPSAEAEGLAESVVSGLMSATATATSTHSHTEAVGENQAPLSQMPTPSGIVRENQGDHAYARRLMCTPALQPSPLWRQLCA